MNILNLEVKESGEFTAIYQNVIKKVLKDMKNEIKFK